MWTRSPWSNGRKKCHRVPRTFHNCHKEQTSRGWEEEPCENFTFLYSFAVYISSRAIYTRLSKLWGFWTERWCNWALMDYAGLYRAVMYCTGLYGAILACTGRQWVIRGVGWSGWPTWSRWSRWQVARVIKMISLDDMHSENILFSCLNHQIIQKLRCHASDLENGRKESGKGGLGGPCDIGSQNCQGD